MTQASNSPTRRAFAAGFGTLAAAGIASSSLQSPANALPADDAKLVALSEQMTALRIQEKAAWAECMRCHDILETQMPEKPRALLWRVGDPVGNTRLDAIKLPNGSEFVWCDIGDIRKLAQRKRPFLQWIFDGTEGDWKRMGLVHESDGLDFPGPVKGFEHLFRSFPDEHKNKRAAELVSAYNEWQAKHDNVLERSGYNVADKAREAIQDEMGEVYERMLALRPTTLEGYRALALAVIEHCWCGEIKKPEYGDEHGLAVIVSSLTSMPIVDAA